MLSRPAVGAGIEVGAFDIANEKLYDFMKFQCDPPTAQGITCKFQEVGVHRKGGPDELAKSLAHRHEEHVQECNGHC
jgi:hypothetical protein